MNDNKLMSDINQAADYSGIVIKDVEGLEKHLKKCFPANHELVDKVMRERRG